MTKLFDLDVLLARVKAVLQPTERTEARLSAGGCRLTVCYEAPQPNGAIQWKVPDKTDLSLSILVGPGCSGEIAERP